MYITSFAVRTKNIENKPVVNERGAFAPINLPEKKKELKKHLLLRR
jgi:hypothetical protein